MPSQSNNHQLIRYAISGLSAVLVDVSLYLLLLSGLGYNGAKAVSFISGSAAAYGLNKFWTFRKPARSGWEVLRFCLLYATTLGINVAINHGVITMFPDAPIIAVLCATGTSTVLNFLGQKFWVFREIPIRETTP